ncbi:hypothetical protein BRD00_10870 [Halobacteriales archaeon QS_8_69_26]|nr:MAG: hypothetical protein BRD00_10870 [Halobacteriales archaeon QS_8_69_26]
MTRRRRFLSSVGVVAVAGCLGGDGGDASDGGATDGDDTAGESTDEADGDGDPTDEPGAVEETADDPGEGTTATTTTETTTTLTTPAGNAERIVKGRQELEEGESSPFRWGVVDPATLDYEFEVVDGPAIDVLLFRGGQFELFRQGQAADWIAEGSAPDSTGDRGLVDLEPIDEDCVLVLDHTRFGPSDPPKNALDDPAIIDLEVDLYR